MCGHTLTNELLHFIIGQYGEPVISEYREYIPPPPLEEKKKNPLSVKGTKSSDDESDDNEGSADGSAEGSADEGSGDEDDGLTQEEKGTRFDTMNK